MEELNKVLRLALNKLQEKTIGLAYIGNTIELVVDEDEHTFTTILIGSLGGFSTNHYPKSNFTFLRFPEKYNNLLEFLDDVYPFNDWYNKHF